MLIITWEILSNEGDTPLEWDAQNALDWHSVPWVADSEKAPFKKAVIWLMVCVIGRSVGRAWIFTGGKVNNDNGDLDGRAAGTEDISQRRNFQEVGDPVVKFST